MPLVATLMCRSDVKANKYAGAKLLNTENFEYQWIAIHASYRHRKILILVLFYWYFCEILNGCFEFNVVELCFKRDIMYLRLTLEEFSRNSINCPLI